MAWITLSVEDVKRALSSPELTALQSVSLAGSDPFPSLIADIVREVRGYVAACERNTLGDGDTIPEKLKNAAINRIRYEAFTRLPVNRSLLTEDRVTANKDAIRLLERVADCKFQVEEPVTPDADDNAGGSVEVVTCTTRIAKPADMAGL